MQQITAPLQQPTNGAEQGLGRWPASPEQGAQVVLDAVQSIMTPRCPLMPSSPSTLSSTGTGTAQSQHRHSTGLGAVTAQGTGSITVTSQAQHSHLAQHLRGRHLRDPGLNVGKGGWVGPVNRNRARHRIVDTDQHPTAWASSSVHHTAREGIWRAEDYVRKGLASSPSQEYGPRVVLKPSVIAGLVLEQRCYVDRRA